LDKDTAYLVIRVLLDYIEENNAGLVLVTHDEFIANMCNSRYRLENRVLIKS